MYGQDKYRYQVIIYGRNTIKLYAHIRNYRKQINTAILDTTKLLTIQYYILIFINSKVVHNQLFIHYYNI